MVTFCIYLREQISRNTINIIFYSVSLNHLNFLYYLFRFG